MPKFFVALLAVLLMMPAGAFAQLAAPEVPVRAALNFKTVQAGQQAVIAVTVDVPEGYHVFGHAPGSEIPIAFELTMDDNPAIKVLGVQFPEQADYKDVAFGDVKVYFGSFTTYVPIEILADAPLGELKITGEVLHQTCDENHCLAPKDESFEVTTTVVAAGQPVEPSDASLFEKFNPASIAQLIAPNSNSGGSSGGASDDGAISLFGIRISADNYVLIFVLGLLAGAIFNVMPCVLPIIPIKAMGFYEVAKHNAARSLALATAFSLGIIATFGLLALLVLVLKVISWGELFAMNWFNIPMVIILLVLSLSMFGVFNISLPQSVYNVSPRHDTYTGNFLFGILTAVLSTPCTFGLFFLLLGWAATQPAAVAILLMMTTGLGMALPYLLLAMFPQAARKFPRVGPWPEVIKQMMGFLLIATALFFGKRYLPVGEAAGWWLIFAVVAVSAVFLLARTIQFAPRARPIVISTILGLLMVVGTGAFVRLKVADIGLWKPYTESSLATARASGKPVMLTFTADWCSNCHVLEASLFSNERVRETLADEDVVLVKVDLTSSQAPGWKLLQELTTVAAIPYTAIYRPDEESPRSLSGLYSGDDLISAIRTN